MNHEFRLADIGEGLEEAEIISWLVHVGDLVARDQPLVEIMTDKSNAELTAPMAGTIVDLPGAIGDIIHVGDLIAVISPSHPASEEAAVTPAAPIPSTPLAQPSVSSPAPTRRAKASPSTRRVAAERGIDLSTVTGTGPGGRILLSDLDRNRDVQPETSSPLSVPPPAPPAPPAATAVPAVPAPPPATAVPAVPAPAPTAATAVPAEAPPASATDPDPSSVGTVPLRGIRRVIAHNMERSWAEIPHIHAFDHVDAEPLLEMRTRLKETGKPAYAALTPLSFFVAAVAQTLATHPLANASIDTTAETITQHAAVNVGIAVAAPQGLVVPVLRGANHLDFDTLSLTLTELIRGAREGSLSREHFQGGTVTITNFGSLGGEQALPIIRAPESVIFGFGSIAERPFVIDHEVLARQTMNLVVGADHRLLDGDVVTAILNDIAASLTDPLRLVL